jgi:predicted outer membrane lipoprotein
MTHKDFAHSLGVIVAVAFLIFVALAVVVW